MPGGGVEPARQSLQPVPDAPVMGSVTLTAVAPGPQCYPKKVLRLGPALCVVLQSMILNLVAWGVLGGMSHGMSPTLSPGTQRGWTEGSRPGRGGCPFFTLSPLCHLAAQPHSRSSGGDPSVTAPVAG